MPTRKITRAARRAGGSVPQPKAKVSEYPSLVDLLSAVQHNNIGILPVSPHKGLGILGKGLSGGIQQSTADLSTVLAFKEGIPSKIIHDTDHDQDWYSLVTEVTILQHPPIQANPHIIELLGISFYITAGRRAWPVAVTSKVNRGDLTTILTHNRDGFLTEDVRMVLFAGLAEALYVLHSCGVAHGDIKTENIVIEVTEDNQINLLLIDFGSSVISGQTRLPTRSEPWNAPELENASSHLNYEELAQTDLYSFGLVCLHLLLPVESLVGAGLCLIRSQDQTDDQWAKELGQKRLAKASEGRDSLTTGVLGVLELSDVSQDRRTLLRKIFDATIQPPPGRRRLPWEDILPYIQQYLSHSYHETPRPILYPPPLAFSSVDSDHSKHRIFRLGATLGELDDTDYVLPINIFEDLSYKADNSACESCRRDYAFQISICYIIGFGCFRSLSHSQQWLEKSGGVQRDLNLAINDIAKQYKHSGRVEKEYQLSKRLPEAERALREQVEARALILGDSELWLAKLNLELSLTLKTRFRLVEAEKCQMQVTKILREHLGDQHPNYLMATVDLASTIASQGLLRQAERLLIEVQPSLEAALGPRHPETITSLQVQAGVQFELGEVKKAEHLFRQVVSVRTKALTAIHPLTVRAELSLVTVLWAQGSLTEASAVMQSIDEKVAGAFAGDNMSKAQFSITSAMLYAEMGQLDHALEKVAEGLAAMDTLKLPENDSLRLDGLETLSVIYDATMEKERQEVILRQVLELKSGQDERDRKTLTTTCLLARNLLWQFRLDEASVVAKKVLAASSGSITEDPEIHLTALNTLAKVLTCRGQVDEAEKMREEFLNLCEVELGQDNTFTLHAASLLGILLADRGKFLKAQHLYERVLSHLGSGPQPGIKAIKVKRLLADTYCELGDFEKGMEQCQEGIVWATSALGESHMESLALYNTMGRIYTLTERFVEADQLYITKLEKQSEGTEMEAFVAENMSTLRRRQNRLEEALELKAKSKDLMKASLGENHPVFIKMEGNFLSDYMAQPKTLTQDLEKDVLENIKRKKAILGANHPSAIMTMCDLAHAYADLGRLLESDKLFQEAWDSGNVSKIQSPERYATLLARRANVNFRLSRFSEAEGLERESLAVRQRIFDETHSAILTNMGNLASTLNAQGKYSEAEDYLRQVVAIRERILASEIRTVHSFLKSRIALGAVLFFQSKLAESLDLYVSSIAVAEEVGLPDAIVNVWRADLNEVLKKSADFGTPGAE